MAGDGLLLPRALVMVAPRAVPDALSRTPRVIVVEGLVVVRVCPRLSVDALLREHARGYLVVIVVMLDDLRRCHLSLNDAGRRISFNFSPSPRRDLSYPTCKAGRSLFTKAVTTTLTSPKMAAAKAASRAGSSASKCCGRGHESRHCALDTDHVDRPAMRTSKASICHSVNLAKEFWFLQQGMGHGESDVR